METNKILQILHEEFDLAEDIEASVGVAPTAQEALSNAIDKINLLVAAQILVTK
ncbi:hypothetical protein UFOVP764_49 [uncultured Caudovirales phage]|uniref:Uncharacterized protein n=1 Tax=uncultured Caudovirales phage TaxID=2100421 RepID=A0A6J5P1I7_9CAUD|nr:hypothetical protein UFOVP764_49 [uncultured Caudovirales phage]